MREGPSGHVPPGDGLHAQRVQHERHAQHEKHDEKHDGTHDEEREHGPPLDEQEKKKADEEETLNTAATHEVIRREGLKELERPATALAWSGLAAGAAMGLSMAAEGVLQAHLPDAEWRPLISKLGYAFGFLIVILGSQQLFTENTLLPIVPLLARRTREIFGKVLILWGVVLVTNLIAASGFAYVAARTNAFQPEVREAFAEIGARALAGSFGTMFIRAIFAGWIIALMVWMLPAAQSARIWVIILLSWLIGVGHFAHIIVGTVEVMYLVWTDVVTLGDYFTRFMIPALLGNIIGGVVLVALVNHQQAAAGHGVRRGHRPRPA